MEGRKIEQVLNVLRDAGPEIVQRYLLVTHDSPNKGIMFVCVLVHAPKIEIRRMNRKPTSTRTCQRPPYQHRLKDTVTKLLTEHNILKLKTKSFVSLSFCF